MKPPKLVLSLSTTMLFLVTEKEVLPPTTQLT